MKKSIENTRNFIICAVLVIALLLSVISLVEIRKTEALVAELADTVSVFVEYTQETLAELDSRLSDLETEVFGNAG